MTPLQPPPPLLQKLGVAIFQWFHDTWSKLKVLQTQANTAIYVSGLTVVNGSPDGADISWSSCTIFYNGTAYPIAAGNTTGGATLVWWDVGGSSFSFGTSYTPAPTRFDILTNTLGVHDVTWNKVGANSVQETQVLGGFNSGYAPQNPSDVTVGGASSSTDLLNVAFAGGIVSVGITDVSGSADCSGGNLTLSLTFDGSAPQVYIIKLATVVTWSNEALNSSVSAVGTGASAGDRLVIPFGTAFKQSCVVAIKSPGGLGGSLACTVNWAKKII